MWRWPISRADHAGLRRRLLSDRAWIVAAAGVVILVAVAALAPLIVDLIGVPRPSVRNAGTVSGLGIPAGPSGAHPFGVDRSGHDLLSEVIYGLRSSLEAGLLGTLIALALGVAIGVAASSSARWFGHPLMRVVDTFLAFPAVLLGIAFGGACGRGGCASGLIKPGLGVVVAVIALSAFPYVARFVCDRPLDRNDPEFRRKARRLGASTLAYSATLVPVAILLEAALSFLGVGIRFPDVSLGQLIAGAGAEIVKGDRVWWYLLFPGLTLLLCVLCFELLGDGLVKAFDVPAVPAASAEPHSRLAMHVVRLLLEGVAVVVLAVALIFALFRGLVGAGRHGGMPAFWDLLHLDLGTSYRNGQEVLSVIFDRLPATISVAGGALVVCILLALVLGTLQAIGRGSVLSRVGRAVGAAARSTPLFWFALVAVYVFANNLGVFPLFDGPDSYAGLTASASRWFGSLVLPWLVLGILLGAACTSLVGARLQQTMSEGYIAVARAWGVRERRVLRHALRAALPPLLPRLGLRAGALLGGVVLIEKVFDIPGLGLLAFDAVHSGDLPVVEGVLLVGMLLVVVARLLLEISQALLDPRMRRP